MYFACLLFRLQSKSARLMFSTVLQVLRRTVAQAQNRSDTFFYRKKQHHKITSDDSSTSGIIMQSWKSCKALINGSWSHLKVPLQLYQNFFHCVNTKKQQTKGKKDCQSAFHLSVTDLYKKFVFLVFLDQSKVQLERSLVSWFSFHRNKIKRRILNRTADIV